MSQPVEIHPGIFRITLPLPGEKPGPVNVYLAKGAKTTLIDTGTVKAFPVLKKGLKSVGADFEAIDQVVLTHGHLDHYGAANQIKQAAGGRTRILAHAGDMQNIETGTEVSRKRRMAFFRMAGIPLYIQLLMLPIGLIFHGLAENCHVDETIGENDLVPIGDYTAKVVETPGHSRGSVCLFLEKENILFSGDHILSHITPNAFVMLEEDRTMPARKSQVEYYASLAKIESLMPEKVFPAHGKAIFNLPEIIHGYRENYSARKQLILGMVEKGEDSVYRIARKMFPDIGGFRLPLEIYLAVSEVFTHLEALETENLVAFHKNGKRMKVYPR